MGKNNDGIDALTGLGDRDSFDEYFLIEVTRCQARGTPLSIAFVDVDHFDEYNHAYGRECGDSVLKETAKALSGIEGGVPFRYGGDEFVVVFRGIERERALLALEKARAGLSVPLPKGVGDPLGFTLSAGIAAFSIDGNSVGELLRSADGALYRAKIAGRDRVMLAYDEKMVAKTSHYAATQLERLAALAKSEGTGEAALLREALDDLLVKYEHGFAP